MSHSRSVSFVIFIICYLTFGLKAQSDNYFCNIHRGSLYSASMKMDKNYQVFLPESYHYSLKSTFPVIYLVDGDYNFLYQTGLIESYSNISEKIPEVIVVAISDSGNEAYKRDCTMLTPSNPQGNASNFMRYIQEELKPEINREFRTSSFEVLIGHSLGGLLTTIFFLENQQAFDAYIAIDPSYWWDNDFIVDHADSLFKNNFEMESELFISLADSRRMSVHEMVGRLETYHADSKKWSFNYYPEENHGSVGVVTVKDGLLKIFTDWELSRSEFYEFDSSKDLIDFYKERKKQYNSELRLPPLLFGNMLYYYYRSEKWEELKNIEAEIVAHFPSSADDFYAKMGSYHMTLEKYDEAKKLLNTSIASNKNAYKSHDILSKIYFSERKFNEAETEALLAMKIAKRLRARQWQLNELQSNIRKIQNEIGKD